MCSMAAAIALAFPCAFGGELPDALRATVEAVAPGARFHGPPDAPSFTGRVSGSVRATTGGWNVLRADGAVFRVVEGGSGVHVADGRGRMLYSVRADGDGFIFVPAVRGMPAVRAVRSASNPAAGLTGWRCDGQLMAALPAASDRGPRTRMIDTGELYDRMYEGRKTDRKR